MQPPFRTRFCHNDGADDDDSHAGVIFVTSIYMRKYVGVKIRQISCDDYDDDHKMVPF